MCTALPAPRDLVRGTVGEHRGGSAQAARIRTLGDLKTWPRRYPGLLQCSDGDVTRHSNGHLLFSHPLGEKKA